jgi:hypothetical protein
VGTRPYPTKDFSFADKARGPIGKSARLWRYKSMDWVAESGSGSI